MRASSTSEKPYIKPTLDAFVNHEGDQSFKEEQHEKNLSIVIKSV